MHGDECARRKTLPQSIQTWTVSYERQREILKARVVADEQG